MLDLIGFDYHIDKLLNNYKNNNLHSSIILHGPKGIGKRTFVSKFISKILKLKINEDKYLHHLNLFSKNSHPNIKIIEKEIDKKTKKTNANISIDQIRNLKKFNFSSPSIANLDKFIIIDSADDLNLNSANSFLKNLEEPNNNTFYFLISHQISNLLTTLRSRCLKVKFNSHSFENFKKILTIKIKNLNEDEIKFFYDLTQGSPGISLSLHKDNILEYLNLTINCLYNKGINEDISNLSTILSKLDNEKFKNYLSVLKSILIIINKMKTTNQLQETYLSDILKKLQDLSTFLSYQNIIDRFDFLTKNENELFIYNFDKKLFIQNFMIL